MTRITTEHNFSKFNIFIKLIKAIFSQLALFPKWEIFLPPFAKQTEARNCTHAHIVQRTNHEISQLGNININFSLLQNN